jgi:aldose 1-epimerase
MIEKTNSFARDGETYEVFTLTNSKGCSMEVLTYGARITKLVMPARDGSFGDVIVGYAKAEDYIGAWGYYGATIGRFGNRIGGAKFTLDGVEYALETNNGRNTLHGGKTENFDRKNWKAEIKDDKLEMSILSKDGAGGYPGNLTVKVSFSLTEENEAVIDYYAITDKDTVCNLTNHAYFNLGGQETILGHELMIRSHYITPTDDELIPHGELMNIDDTPFSFYDGKLLGKDMFCKEHLIDLCHGYDFNYCIDRKGDGLEHFAYVYDKESGRRMDCYTTLPGVQLYTSNGLYFKGKKDYGDHCALCLETQGYPNSPNCPEYPTTTLKAGEEYKQTTVYKFSIR